MNLKKFTNVLEELLDIKYNDCNIRSNYINMILANLYDDIKASENGMHIIEEVEVDQVIVSSEIPRKFNSRKELAKFVVGILVEREIELSGTVVLNLIVFESGTYWKNSNIKELKEIDEKITGIIASVNGNNIAITGENAIIGNEDEQNIF